MKIWALIARFIFFLIWLKVANFILINSPNVTAHSYLDKLTHLLWNRGKRTCNVYVKVIKYDTTELYVRGPCCHFLYPNMSHLSFQKRTQPCHMSSKMCRQLTDRQTDSRRHCHQFLQPYAWEPCQTNDKHAAISLDHTTSTCFQCVSSSHQLHHTCCILYFTFSFKWEFSPDQSFRSGIVTEAYLEGCAAVQSRSCFDIIACG